MEDGEVATGAVVDEATSGNTAIGDGATAAFALAFATAVPLPALALLLRRTVFCGWLFLGLLRLRLRRFHQSIDFSTCSVAIASVDGPL